MMKTPTIFKQLDWNEKGKALKIPFGMRISKCFGFEGRHKSWVNDDTHDGYLKPSMPRTQA